MSTLAVIVAVLLVMLLLGMLIAVARKAARPHARHNDDPAGDDRSYRSHAEASRRTDAERL